MNTDTKIIIQQNEQIIQLLTQLVSVVPAPTAPVPTTASLTKKELELREMRAFAEDNLKQYPNLYHEFLNQLNK